MASQAQRAIEMRPVNLGLWAVDDFDDGTSVGQPDMVPKVNIALSAG